MQNSKTDLSIEDICCISQGSISEAEPVGEEKAGIWVLMHTTVGASKIVCLAVGFGSVVRSKASSGHQIQLPERTSSRQRKNSRTDRRDLSRSKVINAKLSKSALLDERKSAVLREFEVMDISVPRICERT
jgi:hypothetical protein